MWSGRLNCTALFSIQCKHTQHFWWQIYIIHSVDESKFSYNIVVNLTSKIKPKSILQQKVLLWSFIIQNVSYFAKRKVFVVKKAYFIGLLVLVSMFASHVAICDKLKSKEVDIETKSLSWLLISYEFFIWNRGNNNDLNQMRSLFSLMICTSCAIIWPQ